MYIHDQITNTITIKLFCFPIFQYWAYLLKVILETQPVMLPKFDIYVFISIKQSGKMALIDKADAFLLRTALIYQFYKIAAQSEFLQDSHHH